MMKNKKFFWNMVGTTINSFLSLVLLIIITRINGIELSGSFSFVFTITLILQMFSNYGGRLYQVSDYQNEFSFSEYLGSRMKTTILSIIFLIIICHFYKFDITLTLIAFFLMIFRIIETFSDIFYASFQKNDRLDIVGISLTLKSILILLIFFVVDYITMNIIYASLGLTVATFLVFIIYDLRKVREYEKLHFKLNNGIYNQSKYIFMFGFVITLIINVARFVGVYTLDSIEIGYLGILMMIPTVMLLGCQFITQPEIINLTKLLEKKKINEFESLLNKCIKLLLIFGLLCIILAITLGPMVLNLLYGINFESYRIAFVILILAGTFNGVTTIYSNALTILRNTKVQLKLYSIILFVNLLLCYLMSSYYGLNGICIGMAISLFVQNIVFYISYKKEIKKAM